MNSCGIKYSTSVLRLLALDVWSEYSSDNATELLDQLYKLDQTAGTEFVMTFRKLGLAKDDAEASQVLSESLSSLCDVQEEREKMQRQRHRLEAQQHRLEAQQAVLMFSMFVPCTFSPDSKTPKEYPAKEFINTVLSYLNVDGADFFHNVVPLFDEYNNEHFDQSCKESDAPKILEPPGLSKVTVESDQGPSNDKTPLVVKQPVASCSSECNDKTTCEQNA